MNIIAFNLSRAALRIFFSSVFFLATIRLNYPPLLAVDREWEVSFVIVRMTAQKLLVLKINVCII